MPTETKQQEPLYSIEDENKKLKEALRMIEKRAAKLDNNVNKAGYKQISAIWEIAYRCLSELPKENIPY